MARKHPYALGSNHVPKLRVPIEGARRKLRAVGGASHRDDGPLVPEKDLLVLARSHAPEVGCAIHATCDHEHAVGRDVHGEHSATVAIILAITAAGLRAPKPYDTIIVGSRDEELRIPDRDQHSSIHETRLFHGRPWIKNPVTIRQEERDILDAGFPRNCSSEVLDGVLKPRVQPRQRSAAHLNHGHRDGFRTLGRGLLLPDNSREERHGARRANHQRWTPAPKAKTAVVCEWARA
mmetsp:Transcript_51570/g.131150  ORF Transcript_51570/g.131150 Transcript_51570/m.131150 type:complete len:236 (+) Transcript_51570:635-1342(+)